MVIKKDEFGVSRVLTLEEIMDMIDTGEVDTMQLKICLPEWIDDDYFCQLFHYIEKISRRKVEKVTIYENGEQYTMNIYTYSSKCRGYSFHYRSNTKCLFIQLPHHHVLGTDQDIIIRNIKEVMKEHFKIPQEYIDKLDNYILLMRIDYKRDYRYHNFEEYCLIREIIDRVATRSIVKDNYKFEVLEDTESKYMVAYKSSSNKTVEFVIYNKDKEQLNKYRQKKISLEQYKQNTNLIRFEVRVKNGKLHSLKNRDGTTKEICNYKNKDTADELFTYYAKQVYFTQPFYRIDIALNKVKESDERKDMKDNLCKVLSSINKIGYTETRRIYSKPKNKGNKPNYSKFNRYIKKLEELGVNPLTYSETWLDGQQTTYEQIPNFTLAENCITEEGYIG